MRQRTDCSLQTSFITSAKKDEGGGRRGLHDQVLNKTVAVILNKKEEISRNSHANLIYNTVGPK